jgi:Ca2+-binding EF-hand superfamily protein
MHTKREYVDNGGYMTPQARAGIFRAADGNADGVVTRAEYVLNRIITDEAKTIVQGMDDDKDGLVERAEFVQHAAKLLSDPKLAQQIYAAFDANDDGGITIPEYLRVWGQWARLGKKPAEERIAKRRMELADTTSEDAAAEKPGRKPAGVGGGRPGSGPPSGRPGGGPPSGRPGGPPGVDEVFKPRGIELAPANCPACAMGLTAESVFKRLDFNEDGKIVVEEFAKSPGMHGETQAREAVAKIDIGGDGALEWKEFEKAYRIRHANCKKTPNKGKEVGGPVVGPGERGDGSRFAQVFILRSDRDGDGRIARREFRGADAGFERLDKNGNGFIEPGELNELHQKRLADPKTMRQRLQEGDVRRPQ